MEVVGSAGDGEEALELVARTDPDVVLMDLSMPRVDGVEATRRIVATGSPARVVVLTSFSDRKRIVDALDAGAIGYLPKDAEPDDLLRGGARPQTVTGRWTREPPGCCWPGVSHPRGRCCPRGNEKCWTS